MTAFSDVSGGPGFKDAFYTIAKDSIFTGPYSSVYTSFGHPGLNQPADIVAFLDVNSDQEIVALSNARRSREEQLTLKVTISSYMAGNADNDLAPSDRAFTLLSMLEKYVRVTDTTLGGAVRQCFLTSYTSTGYTDPQSLAKGRTIDIDAIFTALVRITS